MSNPEKPARRRREPDKLRPWRAPSRQAFTSFDDIYRAVKLEALATYAVVLAAPARAVIYYLSQSEGPLDQRALKTKLANLKSEATGKPLLPRGSEALAKLLRKMARKDILQVLPPEGDGDAVPRFSLTDSGADFANLLQEFPFLVDWVPDEPKK